MVGAPAAVQTPPEEMPAPDTKPPRVVELPGVTVFGATPLPAVLSENPSAAIVLPFVD
jgi:hypothetical protein